MKTHVSREPPKSFLTIKPIMTLILNQSNIYGRASLDNNNNSHKNAIQPLKKQFDVVIKLGHTTISVQHN